MSNPTGEALKNLSFENFLEIKHKELHVSIPFGQWKWALEPKEWIEFAEEWRGL